MGLLIFNTAARPVGWQGFHFRLLVATTNHAEKDIRPQVRLQNLMLRRMILLEVRNHFKPKGEHDLLVLPPPLSDDRPLAPFWAILLRRINPPIQTALIYAISSNCLRLSPLQRQQPLPSDEHYI